MTMPSAATGAGGSPPSSRAAGRPALAHAAPFAAWVLLMAVSGEPAGWKYALRSAVVLAMFLALRPWRWYAAPRPGNLPLALACGCLVFLAWVAPETPWFGRTFPAEGQAVKRVAFLALANCLRPWRPRPTPRRSAAGPWRSSVCWVPGS